MYHCTERIIYFFLLTLWNFVKSPKSNKPNPLTPPVKWTLPTRMTQQSGVPAYTFAGGVGRCRKELTSATEFIAKLNGTNGMQLTLRNMAHLGHCLAKEPFGKHIEIIRCVLLTLDNWYLAQRTPESRTSGSGVPACSNYIPSRQQLFFGSSCQRQDSIYGTTW